MPYSRPLWPVLLWLACMLTTTELSGPCPSWLDIQGNEEQLTRHYQQFANILARFDCPQPYSVKFQCTHCMEAYMEWLCTALLEPVNRTLKTVRPCRSFCHRVEQKCPFFLPLDKGPVHYAGEPTFLCLDPNIEETGAQLEKSSYGGEDCCYEVCSDGICQRGSCRPAQHSSSSGSTRPRPPAPLLLLLLLYRTRLLLI